MVEYMEYKYNDKITLPDLGREAVMNSVRRAENDFLKKELAEKNTALDFYYNRNLDKHLEQWFPGSSLSQVPPFGMRVVPRFARSRMMLWKEPPERFVGGEPAEDYMEIAHHLDSTIREFSEIAWLIGKCYLRSKYNERHERLEYDIVPHVKEYCTPDGDLFGVSYEVGKDHKGKRQFVFWSEARNGEPGLHFLFDTSSQIKQVGESMDNPYNIIPVSKVQFPSDSMDVARAALQVSIAMTEIALATRFALGQPVITGIDTEIPNLKAGIERLISLPEGASLQYVSPTGSIKDMIESVKMMVNQVGQNHSLAIRWGEGGTPPSGEALKILSMENLESRESDIPIFREWEASRYEIDRTILQIHTGKVLPESYAVDFSDAGFPTTWAEEKDRLQFQLDNNLISRKELIRYFNEDITDDELAEKMGELQEEEQPQQTPLLSILQS